MRTGDPSPKRSRGALRAVRVGASAAIVSVLLLVVAGCGGTDSNPPTEARNLLTTKEIQKYPPGSAERAFLSFWSDLQYQSWAEAATYYSPGLREFVGTAKIVGAKKVDASTFPLVKPVIAGTTDDGDTTTIRYSIVLPEGTTELGSTSWRKEGGNWEMTYDSRLDPELNQFARNQVEIEENGAVSSDASQPPSAAAAQAGVEASHLQAESLEEALREKGH
ncbi:MAG: hypothetical protein JSS68_02595 [Actinobacteria bacterium]|nr:hypothetical protein [Actinomycetota bacterium]MBS1885081.1 hypothetical protein [Actinomycetota bacterium]